MQPLRGPFRNSDARALAGSLLLHFVIAFALWQLPRAPAAVRAPEQFVPLVVRPLPEIPAPEPDLAEREPLPEPAPEPAPEPDAEPNQQPDQQPLTESVAEPSDAVEPTTATEPEPVADEPAAVEVVPRIPEDADLDEVRETAIASVVEAIEAESRRHRFSLQDLTGGDEFGDEDPDGDGSDLSVFERAAQIRGDGVMAPGRARSRFGRAVARICNELTGGFSIFGMVDVCADPRPRADLFGHIRPEYMNSVPLCTAEEDLTLEVEETGNGAIGSLRCVLVPRAVREEFFSRYDPELAYWLPAEEEAAD